MGSGEPRQPSAPYAGTVFAFNGDADGLAAQQILGLEIGHRGVLKLTGTKREIELLDRLPPMSGGHVHALDISLRRNLGGLPGLLANRNIKVTWYDHHDPGEPPADANLIVHVNQAPETCTAAIVNTVFGHRHPLWAALAAFGDNLPATGSALASAGGASAHEAQLLKRAGVLVNYNAYGEAPGDQLFSALELAERMEPHISPLDFCWDADIFPALAAQFESDREAFQALTPLVDAPSAKAFISPDTAFARRYGATWANERALENPDEAFAILQVGGDGNYRVSIRAPRRTGTVPAAGDLAKEFAGGGGRRLAAGIDALPPNQLDRFADRFAEFFT